MKRPAALHPIIPGFHPDPSICLVDGAYYIACSSFEYAPGVPLWRSTDLVTWDLVTNILATDEQLTPGVAASSRGVYAPTLRHHDGRLWLITTDVFGGGNLIVTATHPEGPWSAPVWLADIIAIDPDIAWDDDGRCLVTYCDQSGGPVAIRQVEVDTATGKLLEEPRLMWSGTGLHHPEAPHLYQRGDWWYLMIAEGGTERGHAVSIARSRSPRGPFEGNPANPILTHRSLSHPVQNTGHADMVQTNAGDWAMVYLGVRARGFTPWFHVNGRETFLAGIDWVDDWPVVDESRFEVPQQHTGFVDTFDAAVLHPRWVSPGLRPEAFVQAADAGGALVFPADSPVGRPSLLATRCVDEWWTARTAVEPGDATAVLALRMDDRHSLEVRASAGAVWATAWIAGLPIELGRADAGEPVVLQLSTEPPTTDGPDDVVASVLVDGEPHELGRIDGRYFSTEVVGGFTGRVVGVRAERGPVTLRSFEYQPTGA